MDLRLSELQELIRQSADDFIENEVPSSRVREIEESGDASALWQQMTELGWPGLIVAEAHGGQGGALLDAAVLIDRLCRGAVLSPFAATTLCAATVQAFADDELKQRLLPRVVQGAVVTAAALERTGAVHAPITATYANGTVSGEKWFVEFGASADVHVVAVMQGDTPGLAVVTRDQPGVATRALKNIGALPMAQVTYDGAQAEGFIAGREAVEYLRMLGAALVSLECYAYAQKSLDMIVDYAQMRVQFGRPIGAFEAVQQRVADMAIQVEACRFLTHELLWHFDNGSLDPTQVPVVKAATGRMVGDVTMWSHILHGGIGYMKEYDLQFFTRRGKEAASRWGSLRESSNAIADAVLA